MRLLRLTTRLLSLTLGLALCTPGTSAGIGIGDMLKNKVKAVKGAPKPKSAPSGETGAIKSRIDPPATPEEVVKFKAALQLEGTDRAKSTKFLATLKTPEAWDKCRIEYQMSPEGMKLGEKLTTIPENASMEERNKILAQIAADLDKAFVAKCGPDPSKYNSGQMMRDALAKGSDAFEKEDWKYASWKEWVLAFCEYIEALKKQSDAQAKLAQIKADGLRIPGQGTGIYFVYTATESNLLLDQCESLVPLIQATM
jgi:hypothetical protein